VKERERERTAPALGAAANKNELCDLKVHRKEKEHMSGSSALRSAFVV